MNVISRRVLLSTQHKLCGSVLTLYQLGLKVTVFIPRMRHQKPPQTSRIPLLKTNTDASSGSDLLGRMGNWIMRLDIRMKGNGWKARREGFLNEVM
jgi:hypothetical protein